MPLPSGRRSGRKRLYLGIGLAISLASVAIVLRQAPLADAWRVLADFHWIFLLSGLLSLAFGYAMRIHRWAAMLRTERQGITGIRCIAPFMGSIALNNVLPFRAGDVVRALVFPSALGVTRTAAAASLILERLADVLTLLLFLGIGVALSDLHGMAARLQAGSAAIAIAACVLLSGVLVFNRPTARLLMRWEDGARGANSPRLGTALGVARTLVESMAGMTGAAMLRTLIPVSILVWAGEAGLFLALLAGLGIEASPVSVLMVVAVATLSTLLPSSPGYVGTFHLAAFAAVLALGGTTAQAASFAFLCHLALWLPTTLAGALAIAANPALFRGVTSA